MTTSSSAASGPRSASTRAVTSASPPSSKHNYVTGFDVRCGVLEEPKVDAGRVVEAAGGDELDAIPLAISRHRQVRAIKRAFR